MLSILVAGSGGQGILYLGKVLAESAMLGGQNVTWFPSYGAEMRGGTANCTVVVSDEMIGSPIIKHPDVLVALNAASLKRFISFVKKGGLVLYDNTQGEEAGPSVSVNAIGIPAARIAVEMGNPRSANMVMLGALLRARQIVSREAVLKALSKASDKIREINKAAFLKGSEQLVCA